MAEDLKQLLGEVIEHVDQKAVETQRHFEVLTEHLDHRFDLLAEQVAANTEKLVEHDQRFDKIDQRIENIEVRMVSVEEDVKTIKQDMVVVKTDIGFIKTELSQKVSREEFAFLESRVAALENKR